MLRERGKVPTKTNKDMVASGSQNTSKQIIAAGSKTIPNLEALEKQREQRIKTGKYVTSIDRELMKGQEKKPTIAIQPKAKEFTKRIEHGLNKCK